MAPPNYNNIVKIVISRWLDGEDINNLGEYLKKMTTLTTSQLASPAKNSDNLHIDECQQYADAVIERLSQPAPQTCFTCRHWADDTITTAAGWETARECTNPQLLAMGMHPDAGYNGGGPVCLGKFGCIQWEPKTKEDNNAK